MSKILERFKIEQSNVYFSMLVPWYLMSKKSWPILYSKLLHKMGHDFLDIQYIYMMSLNWINREHRMLLMGEVVESVVNWFLSAIYNMSKK